MTTRPVHGAPRVTTGPVMLDPGNFTPYYIDGLCGAFHRLGVDIRVISAPPLFEPVDPGGQYQVEHCFFPLLGGRVGRLLRHRTRLRQMVKALGYPSGLWRTWRTLRHRPPAVLHVQWALVPLLDGLLARALKARGWRIVHTVHDPLPGPTRPLASRHQRWFLSCADALIVHTPALAQQVISAYPDAAGRVKVIPHGGVPQPLPSETDRLRARQRLGVEEGRPMLLLFGMLKPYKGLDDLLAAMPEILSRYPRCLLVVAGEVLMSLSPFTELIERLGLRESVVLRPTFVPQDEVASYFIAADLVVVPYREIAASGVVVTAQGYGRAVVVTRVGGLPEFVEPDACGLVVPPRDPKALAAAVCRALGDPEELTRMGQRAWTHIAQDHDWMDVARQTRALYDAVTTQSFGSLSQCQPGAR